MAAGQDDQPTIVGIMNELTFVAVAYAADRGGLDVFELSLRLAKTPCGPLYKRNGSPGRAWVRTKR